jgi:hypothetical protein
VIKVFHDKQKLKQYRTTKPSLKKILKGILRTENESKQNHEMTAAPNNKRRKDKKVESNIDSAPHNQSLKQTKKQLNDRNHHIPINTNTDC